ncbi:MAG: aminotransferase class I/II-fold pyridoxal phosphate-dependent enzyme [Phototrophicaceae bacterium]
MPTIARRVQHYGTTIFAEINRLAQQHQALDLGQGRPDFNSPQEVLNTVAETFRLGQMNQYAPGIGAPPLREAVAAHATRFYGLNIDPQNGVIVTSGASEGIFSSVMGIVNPGDEVIVIEPFFDIYVPCIEVAGGVPVYVPLLPPDWRLDRDALKAAFSDKTRAIIVNSPNNPTGRMFSPDDQALIAELCVQYDVVCISDEVYEHIAYAGSVHRPMAALPGMFERTLTVSSAAKTFSATGWKIGWVYGAPDLIVGVWRIHQLVTYAVNHPTQAGAAYALALPDGYFDELGQLYARKRQLMLSALDGANLRYFAPEGAFYVMADFSAVFDGDNMAFVHHLLKEVGVAAIPPDTFYSDAHRPMANHYVRFAFCKADSTLIAAAEKLQKLARKL